MSASALALAAVAGLLPLPGAEGEACTNRVQVFGIDAALRMRASAVADDGRWDAIEAPQQLRGRRRDG